MVCDKTASVFCVLLCLCAPMLAIHAALRAVSLQVQLDHLVSCGGCVHVWFHSDVPPGKSSPGCNGAPFALAVVLLQYFLQSTRHAMFKLDYTQCDFEDLHSMFGPF